MLCRKMQPEQSLHTINMTTVHTIGTKPKGDKYITSEQKIAAAFVHLNKSDIFLTN